MPTSALVLTAALLATVQSGKHPPPGMVFVPGGSTTIGTPDKVVLAMGEQNRQVFLNTTRETPEHTMRVDDFYLGVSEVTNEQYLEYVKATGARPPEAWGLDAIDQASREFVEEQGRRIKEAQAAGQTPPERQKFNQTQWWRENWRTAKWEVPKGRETFPVRYVDYQEASAYARWAGVRLMTEFEFQRAGRGNGKATFPWGESWDPAKCANQAQGSDLPRPVGSFPEGASEFGIHDLAGNVWEWTSSPFSPYPNFKVLELRLKQGDREEVIHGDNRWDANQRVLVGGSFQHGELAARLTTRRGAERDQSTEAVGFRVAASTTPGLDIADAVLRDDIPLANRPEGVAYDVPNSLATDIWRHVPGTATTRATGKDAAGSVPLPGYAVITGYDYILFIPTKDIDAAALTQLDRLSLDQGLVHMGVLATTRPMLEPQLSPGTYMIAYRGEGKLGAHESIAGQEPAAAAASEEKNSSFKPQDPEPQDPEPQEPKPQEGEAKPDQPLREPIVYPSGFDPDVANFVFMDGNLNLIGFMPAPVLNYARPEKPQAIIAQGTRTVQARDENGVPKLDAKERPVMIETPITRVTLKVNTFVRVSNKGFVYALELEFAPDQVTKDWRN